DEWQLDATLAGAGAQPHPAGRERAHRIGETARPYFLQRRGWTECDRACQLDLFDVPHRAQLAERDAARLIILRDALHRAMQIDRLVVAGLADERDHALGLAERIGADEMRA